ncbi:MAG: Na(+)/H(+) antiporter subunit B [Chloroflexaceae bacterium]|nr:Na(+)/H(+) antiporter subunit B [Chloroflexaceae bacterium]
MFDSLILRTVAKIMLPILLLLSLFMVVRGHNLPGGGFVGGLLVAVGLILQIVAFGPERTRKILPVSYISVAAFGVIFGAVWGLLGLFAGQPYMAAFWIPQPIPGIGKVGTPVLFDIGVYFTVVGVITQIALTLAEEPLLFPTQKRPAAEGEPVAPKA